MTSFVIVYPKCFRGAVVFRFPLGTRSLLPANLKELKESLNILLFTKVKTTRKTGGLHEPYKGLRQAAPKGAVKRSADRI